MDNKKHSGDLRFEGPGFSVVYHEVADMEPALHPHSLAVYIQLRRRSTDKLLAFPSYRTLRERCRIGSDRDIKKAIDELIDRGLVQVKNRTNPGSKEKHSNQYTVYNKPHTTREAPAASPVYSAICPICKEMHTPQAVDFTGLNGIGSTHTVEPSTHTVEPSTHTVEPSTHTVEEEKELKNTHLRKSLSVSQSDGQTDGRSESVKNESIKNTIKSNVDYSELCRVRPFDAGLIENFVSVMYNTVAASGDTVRIGKEDKPRSVVVGQFMRIGYREFEYCLDRFKEVTEPIKNKPAYMRTMLYNSLLEADAHYTNLYSSREDG